MSELVKGRAFCHKTLLQIYKYAVLPKLRTALCAASQLPGGSPLMWKMLLHLHVNQNFMMMMMFNKNIQPTVDCEMTTKYSAILFVNLGEYIFKFIKLTTNIDDNI